MLRNRYHLHMFDGDAGGSTGGSIGASAPGSAETTATASSPSGENQQPQVIYGKADVEAEGSSQVGSDDGDASTPNETPDLDAEFDELIKGKYKKQFGDRMQQGIQNRFKNSADYEGQVNQMNEAVAPLMAMYGLDPGDFEGLKHAIETDDSLISARADEEGLTTERFRENLKLKMDAQIGRNIKERMQMEQERSELYREWSADAEDLKQAFPNFDLEMEIQNNPQFAESLDRGNSVKESFILAHFNEMMQGNNAQVSDQATHNAANNFRQRAARPAENGLARQPAIVRKADPSKFTKEDMDEVVRRVRAGETIRF